MVGVTLLLDLLKWLGDRHPTEEHARSFLAWVLGRYRSDFLPALFAVRGIWLLFSRRTMLTDAPWVFDWHGLGGFVATLALYVVAERLEIRQLGCVGLVGMFWFSAFALKGVVVWRKLVMPVVWFVVATPGLFDSFTLPLRIATAGSAAGILDLVGVPVEKQGFTIWAVEHPPWNFTVADECSGVRTITVLLFVALMMAEGVPGWGARTMLVFSALPVGLGANILRTVTIGMVCHWKGEAAGLRFHQTLLAGAGPLACGVVSLVFVAYLLKRRGSAR